VLSVHVPPVAIYAFISCEEVNPEPSRSVNVASTTAASVSCVYVLFERSPGNLYRILPVPTDELTYPTIFRVFDPLAFTLPVYSGASCIIFEDPLPLVPTVKLHVGST
jgi:hypothetical protein